MYRLAVDKLNTPTDRALFGHISAYKSYCPPKNAKKYK